MKTNILITLFFAALFFSCKPQKTNPTDDLAKLVNEWNDAHTQKDAAIFSKLYADTLSFYGQSLHKNKCIENKLAFFDKNPSYKQEIVGAVTETKQSDGTFICNFTKRVSLNDKVTDYPSYLIFKEVNQNWVIIAESDEVTDKNLAKKQTNDTDNGTTTKVKGDFDGDGEQEEMWLVSPKIDASGMDCVGNCISTIVFSKPSIPSIKIANCIGGIPNNLGDLNDDGKDEIGLSPDWFTSCWSAYYVWTLKDRTWIYAVDPIPTHCDLWESNIFPIEKDKKRKGYAIIHYSEMVDDDIKTLTKSVKIK